MKAVDECIEEGILADFLRKNRAEVMRMSLLEYTLEEHMWAMSQHKYAEGRAETILDILDEIGSIPDGLADRIKAERNLDLLRKWAKLARRAESVEDFARQME